MFLLSCSCADEEEAVPLHMGAAEADENFLGENWNSSSSLCFTSILDYEKGWGKGMTNLCPGPEVPTWDAELKEVLPPLGLQK